MKPKDKEEDKSAIEELLFGDGVQKARDLADPRNARKMAKMARMMGIEIRREQLIRIGIAAALILIVLAVGLWVIARVLGLVFWGLVTAAVIAAVVMAARGKPENPEQISRREQKAKEIQNRDADRKADEALKELEQRMKE